MEFQSNFHAWDVKSMNREYWDAHVLAASRIFEGTLRSYHLNTLGHDQGYPPLRIGDVTRNKSLSILAEFYEWECKLARGDLSEVRKSLLFASLGREVRNTRQYPLIGSIYKELKRIRPNLASSMNDFMLSGIRTLFLLACEPNRFLVGLKGGVHWKKVNIASPPDGTNPAILNLASHYLGMLERVGKRELETVPESLVHPDDFSRIHFKATQLPLDKILEDAYFRQRYFVPPEGADVRFRRFGDLARIFAVQSGDEFIAKVSTSYGDETVLIDLQEASYVSPDIKLLKPGEKSPWVGIVAETYHDLVTAEEIYSTRSRRRVSLDSNSYGFGDWDLNNPQVIYIPRKRKITLIEDPRPRYDGPPRPIKPHRVTNHLRDTNMTLRHRDEIYDIEREWGLAEGEIVDNIPAGKTWVRPHFSPSGSEAVLKVGPIFLKRRILTQTGIRLRPSFPKSLDD